MSSIEPSLFRKKAVNLAPPDYDLPEGNRMLFLHNLDRKTWKRWQTIADQCQRRLAAQQISPGDPGTILKDVNTLLEFIGPGGVATRSRNASLPSELLPELNAKAGHPIQLALKRPLLRDYPNLAGIFVLLRVMDLLQMQGDRLAVSPAAWAVWRGLNFTEQYFALLEARLFQAQSSVLGGHRNRREEPEAFRMSTVFLEHLSERWRPFDFYESVDVLGPQGQLPPWHLFALQQLGLIEIRPGEFGERERKIWGGRGWLVGAARLTPWGTAVTWALLDTLKKALDEQEAEYAKRNREAGDPERGEMALPLFDEGAGEKRDSTALPGSVEEEAEAEDEPAESGPEEEFGMLQPAFQPYFPEWQKVYARPRPGAKRGAHIFKVTLAGWQGGRGGIWRRFAVPPEASLDELAGAILRAFKFDDDHLYDFSYRDQRGKQRVYNHPGTDEGPFTSEIAVSETDVALKDTMLFTFDYGDNWQFCVRLEKIEDAPCRQKRAKVIASAGKAPAQYPSSEEQMF
jgi:hypothetical protein